MSYRCRELVGRLIRLKEAPSVTQQLWLPRAAYQITVRSAINAATQALQKRICLGRLGSPKPLCLTKH